MRTSVFSKVVALCALSFLFLVPVTKIRAQIAMPYQAQNLLSCPVRIQYIIFEENIAGICNVPCFTGTMTVPSGGALVPVPVWPGYPTCGCGIWVSVIDVIGTPIPLPPAPGAVSAASPGMPNPPFPPQFDDGPDPSGCSTSGLIKLFVTNGTARIFP